MTGISVGQRQLFRASFATERPLDTVKQGISCPKSNLTCTHPAAELLRTWNSRVSGRLFCRRSDKHNSQNGAVLWVCLFARLLPRSGNSFESVLSRRHPHTFSVEHTLFPRDPAPTRTFRILHPFSVSGENSAEMGVVCQALYW